MQHSNIIIMSGTADDQNPKYGALRSFKATHHSSDGAELGLLGDESRLYAALREWAGTNTIVVPSRLIEETIKSAVPWLDLYRWVSFQDALIPLVMAGEIDEPSLEDAAQYYKVSIAHPHLALVKCWFAYRKQCEVAFMAGKIGQTAADWVMGKLFGGSQEK